MVAAGGSPEDRAAPRWQWISKWGGLGTKPKQEGEELDGKHVEDAGDVWMIDDMERGLSREIATDLLQPLRKSSRLWRFNVTRSDNNLEYRLFTDGWDFLMLASVSLQSQSVLFYQYDSTEHGCTESRPSFTMTFSADKKEWRLMHERCEFCQYVPHHRTCAACNQKQVVAVVRHVQEMVGDGLFHGMEISIPTVSQDGDRALWCPLRGVGRYSGGQVLAAGFGDTPHDNYDGVQKLVTKKPAWNDDVASLVLDFRGRNVLSSSKNFQIAGGARGGVVCQFGKVGPSTFGLDFNHPLSVAQAFAVALSTMFWK